MKRHIIVILAFLALFTPAAYSQIWYPPVINPDGTYLRLAGGNAMNSTIQFATIGSFGLVAQDTGSSFDMQTNNPRFFNAASAAGELTLNIAGLTANRTAVVPNSNFTFATTTDAAGGDATGTLAALTVAKVNGSTPGGTCTNQFARSISSSAIPTCDSVKVADTAFNGTLTNGDGTGSVADTLNKVAGGIADVQFKTASVNRWIVRSNATAEGGSNAGSDFQIIALSDAGGVLSTPLQITRATGAFATVAGITTAGSIGIEPTVGNEADVTQSATLTSTNLVASAPAGLYRVCWDQQITQAASSSSSLQTTIGWNNGAAKTSTLGSLNGGALQTTADASNTLNSEMSYCMTIWSAASQNITRTVTYSSTGATPMQFAWHATVQRLQ